MSQDTAEPTADVDQEIVTAFGIEQTIEAVVADANDVPPAAMNERELHAILETLLFVSHEPVTLDRLAAVLGGMRRKACNHFRPAIPSVRIVLNAIVEPTLQRPDKNERGV